MEENQELNILLQPYYETLEDYITKVMYDYISKNSKGEYYNG